MKRKRFSEEQIVKILKAAEGGMPLDELWRDRSSSTGEAPLELVRSSGSQRLRPGKKVTSISTTVSGWLG